MANKKDTNSKKKNGSKKKKAKVLTKTISTSKKDLKKPKKKKKTLDKNKIFIYSIIFIIGLSLGVTLGLIGHITKNNKNNNSLYYNFSLEINKNEDCNNNIDLYYHLQDGRNIYTYCLNSIQIKNNNKPLKYLELALDNNNDLIDHLISNLKLEKEINDDGTMVYQTNGSRVYSKENIKIITCHHLVGNDKLYNKDIYIGPSDMNYTSGFCERNNTSNEISYEYNCTFTKTYNIVNLLKGYQYDIPNYSYIVVDSFQNHDVQSLLLPLSIKNKLKVNTNYEFTYTIKGIVDHELSEDELITYMINNDKELNVSLDVIKTNKTGMNQKNEALCKYTRK